MRHDGTDRFAMHDMIVPIDGALTADPELAALDGELERAAARVRGGRRKNRRERPSAAFAASLRRRLMSQAATVVRESPAAARTAETPTTPTLGALPGTAERPLRPPTWQRPRAAEVEALNAPRPVAPVIAARTPTVLPAPRWTVLLIAAALIVAAVGLRSTVQLRVAPSSRAGDVAGATLVRDGIASSLTAGAELREGDEISVADSGHATIEIGAGQTRLAPRATVRIERLAAERTVLDQLAGRVFHRVVVGSGASYVVRTAGISWTATGTAFDLDRSTIPDGERLELVAVEHAVVVDGPSLRATIAEGRRAVVLLGPGSPDVTTGSAGAAVLTDPWLVANARRDLALGFPLGIMAGLELAEATPTPRAVTTTPPVEETAVPTISPAGEPTPTPPATPSATPRPTPRPTPKPTSTPATTPAPTPAPTLGALAMSLTSCNGGVVVDWSAYGGARFHHYAVLRNSGPSIPAAWPPQAGSQLLDGSKTTDRTKTSTADAGGDGGSTRWYRVLALDSANRVLASGPVRSGSPAGVADLGELSAAPLDAGTQFGWSPYAGSEACFSFYKLVYSAEDSTPSYLEGSTPAWVGSDRSASGTWLAELPSGTYWFRLQAIRMTDLGKFVVAETSPTAYTVP